MQDLNEPKIWGCTEIIQALVQSFIQNLDIGILSVTFDQFECGAHVAVFIMYCMCTTNSVGFTNLKTASLIYPFPTSSSNSPIFHILSHSLASDYQNYPFILPLTSELDIWSPADLTGGHTDLAHNGFVKKQLGFSLHNIQFGAHYYP